MIILMGMRKRHETISEFYHRHRRQKSKLLTLN